MGRRGHDGFSWLVLGALLGPLSIVLAVSAWRHDEVLDSRVLARGTRAAGPVDMLVGYDGSEASRVAAATAMDLFGDRHARRGGPPRTGGSMSGRRRASRLCADGVAPPGRPIGVRGRS